MKSAIARRSDQPFFTALMLTMQPRDGRLSSRVRRGFHTFLSNRSRLYIGAWQPARCVEVSTSEKRNDPILSDHACVQGAACGQPGVITRKRISFAKRNSRSLSSWQVSSSPRFVSMVVCMSVKCRYEIKSGNDERQRDTGCGRVAFFPFIF